MRKKCCLSDGMNMTDKKVLIAYGTRSGYTEEISQEIAKTLEEKGIQTDLVDLGKTKSKNWPSLHEFSGVLVGTSMKINKWKKEAKSFINKNNENLKKLKFGLFTSGLFAITEYVKAKEDIAKRLMEKHELEADIFDAFGGVMDFTENSKLGKLGRAALKAGAKGMSDEFGIDYSLEECNDYRDWDQIRNFTNEFAELL